MITLEIKALTVNRAYMGRRFSTPLLKQYKRDIALLLPKLDFDTSGLLKLEIEAGFSSKIADLDNICKPFLDCLQDCYGFNDKQVYEIHLYKKIVKKGGEYIKFDIKEL